MNLMDASVLEEFLSTMSLVSIAVACVVALALVAIPLWLERGRIGAIQWPVVGLAQILIGHAILDEFVFEDAFWPSFALGTIALVSGFYFHQRRVSAEDNLDRAQVHEGTVRVFAGIVTGFVLYHFAVGGIPLLSANVETARFNFTSSGLFGIPGRMFLFGLPFLAAYTSYAARCSASPHLTRLNRWVWFEYVGAMLLSGFKGSLVLVLIWWTLLRSMSGRALVLKDVLRARYLAFGLAAVAFGVLVARKYKTLEGLDTPTYLAQRATVIAAAAGALAVRSDDLASDHYYIIDDFASLIAKYSGMHLGGSEIYSLDKIISAQLTGTDLDDDEPNVPVTVGSFPSLVVDFGVSFSVALMFLFGVGYSAVLEGARSAITPFRFASFGLILLMSYTFVVNGNLAYCVLNSGAVLVFLWVVHSVVVATQRHQP